MPSAGIAAAGADGLMKRDIFALFDRNLPAARSMPPWPGCRRAAEPSAGSRREREPVGGLKCGTPPGEREQSGYEQIGNLFVIRKGRPLFLGCIRLIPSVK
jgi:hypothetical protein